MTGSLLPSPTSSSRELLASVLRVRSKLSTAGSDPFPLAFPPSHPSGHFSRDSRDKTSLIIRKLRARKKITNHRGSSASTEQDQDFELDDEAEGDADAVKPATPEEYDSEEAHQTYHEQPHQDSFGSASALKTNWSTFSLPPRAQDHWQQSPYPSPLNAPFPSPLHTPSTATFGLLPQAYSFGEHAGPSSTPSYFQSPTAIPPALVEGKFDHQVGSSTHYRPTGLVSNVPPSPANSSSGSDADSKHTGFVSPAPAPSRTLLGLYHEQATTSLADDNPFATSNPTAETRKPPQYYTLSSHDFGTLYGHTTSSD